jgi:hypothetical protein
MRVPRMSLVSDRLKDFSAGGHLVAAVNTHFSHKTYHPVDAADTLSSTAGICHYNLSGASLHGDEDHAKQEDISLRPDIRVSAATPPTFLLQAEDDDIDGVEQSLAYYLALQKSGAH